MASLSKLPHTCSMYELTLENSYFRTFEKCRKSDLELIKGNIARSYLQIANLPNYTKQSDLATHRKCIIYNCVDKDKRKSLEKLGFKIIDNYSGYNNVSVMSITFKKLFGKKITLREFIQQYFD